MKMNCKKKTKRKEKKGESKDVQNTKGNQEKWRYIIF